MVYIPLVENLGFVGVSRKKQICRARDLDSTWPRLPMSLGLCRVKSPGLTSCSWNSQLMVTYPAILKKKMYYLAKVKYRYYVDNKGQGA